MFSYTCLHFALILSKVVENLTFQNVHAKYFSEVFQNLWLPSDRHKKENENISNDP